ncbi:MAG: mandelate racemase/muconate lactonizing enzyme family protein [Chloroflexi bacterium]|nr:mandelate racemase/muconate lactonizing enzyme family protein [Chloroflexota bacterium]
MKITRVEGIPLKTGPMLVRVYTDEGISGVGECSGRNWKVLKPFIEDVLQPIIVGKDPRRLNQLWEEMFFGTSRLGPMGLQTTGIGAIDIACWDIFGKAVDMPLYDLLGGAARTSIRLYWSTGLGWELQPKEMLAKLEAGYEIGMTAFKIRMDWNSNRQDADPEKDYQIFKLCREFLPDDVPLSFDANNGYSVGTAINQGRRFEQLGIAHFEEPLPQYDYQGLRQVVDALAVPVSSGEQEHTRWQFRDLIQIGNPDILQPDIVMAGGISELRKIYTLGETFNKPVMPHCPSAGISSAASFHLYSTVTNAVRPHEYSYEFSGPREEVESLFQEPFVIERGYAAVPDRPGHGLVIDEAGLDRLRLQ